MPAPGSVWAPQTWDVNAWAASTWADSGEAPPAPVVASGSVFMTRTRRRRRDLARVITVRVLEWFAPPLAPLV